MKKYTRYNVKIDKWIQEHVRLEDYIRFVKIYCVSCTEYIGFDFERYVQQGNYCKTCNAQSWNRSIQKILTEDELDALFRTQYPISPDG